MDIKYLQTTPYGCGMYAVAHALNLDNFVTDERLEASKEFGNTNMQLNTWLAQDGHDFQIYPTYFNGFGKHLPPSLYGVHIVVENPDIVGLPVLFNVKYSATGLQHMVGGKIDKQGLLWLYDSLQPKVRVTTVSKLNSIYKECFGFYTFNNIKGEYVFIHYNLY